MISLETVLATLRDPAACLEAAGRVAAREPSLRQLGLLDRERGLAAPDRPRGGEGDWRVHDLEATLGLSPGGVAPEVAPEPEANPNWVRLVSEMTPGPEVA